MSVTLGTRRVRRRLDVRRHPERESQVTVWVALAGRISRTALALLFFSLAVGALSGCRPKEVVVEYADGDTHVFTADERHAIQDAAERTIPEVRRLLPDLPASIVVRVSTSRTVIPETGENGSSSQPNVIDWQVDATRSEGVAAIARTQLRPTLFHELHHLVRGAVVVDMRLRDHMVREGLATAFERDYGGATPPWGRYPADVAVWAQEVAALPDDAPRATWMFEHPDGRRWIGMRVGTYWVDRAMKASGKTSAELVRAPTDDVVRMAGGL
jgi:hypothetical protein